MSSRRVGKSPQRWSESIKRRGKSRVTTKWLRRHSGSVKPIRQERFIDTRGQVYLLLSNGQAIRELTARKMEV